MSYEVNDRELESVMALPAAQRYEYFIKKIADWEEVWSIGDDDKWDLLTDDTGADCIPVWPASAFASACCTGMWSGHRPRSIPLNDWIEKWIPGIGADGRKVAIFPLASEKGILVEPKRMLENIQAAVGEYGDGHFGVRP